MELPLAEVYETERLLLARARLENAAEIFYAYASKPEATRYVSWKTHETIRDTERYLMYAVKAWAAGVDYSFSIRLRESHQLIGSIGVINEAGRVQVGYIISPSHWNNGYASEACNTLLNVLRKIEFVYRIWTFVDVENEASARVLTRCGLKEEARLKNWFRFINQNNKPKDCILFGLT